MVPITLFLLYEKIQKFKRKLVLLASFVKQKYFAILIAETFVAEKDFVTEKELCNDMCSHLKTLKS